MDDRPAPSAKKLHTQFADWENGDELPGRTLAYLKTGFLPEVLEGLDPTDAVANIQTAWGEWESGTTGPEAVLAELKAQGLGDLLSGLASS